MRTKDVAARCQSLSELFGEAPMRTTFGMALSYADEHCAVFEQPHNPDLMHALGDTHGGVIATLIDNACWFTAAAQYDTWINTVELTTRLLEPAKREDLTATGRVIRAGASLAVAAAEVRSASGRLVAVGEGTFAVSAIPATAMKHGVDD